MLKIRRSIKNKLLISYLLIACIPLLLFGLIIFTSMNRISESQTVENRSMLMRLMSEQIEAYVNQLELYSQSIYLDEIQEILNQDIPTDPIELVNYKLLLFASLEKWYSYMGIQADIENIMFIQEDGRVLAKHEINESFSFSDIDWYNRAIHMLGVPLVFGPNDQPYRHPSAREPSYTISLVRKINNRIDNRLDKKDFGVLLIDVKISDLTKLFRNINIDSNTRSYIINKDNQIVYSDDASLIGTELLIEANDTKMDGWVHYAGEPFFANEYHSRRTDWKLITLDTKSDIKHYTIYFRNLNMLVGLFGILIALILSVIVAKHFTKPLLRLKNSVNQVERGNFHTQAPVISEDEIGSLTESFNRMTAYIQSLINDVYKSEIHRKEAHLKALQSQINPHFLYNTLDSMSAIAVLKKVPIISTMSKMLAEMFRYSISQGEQMVKLHEELQQVSRYLEIQRIRYDDKFESNIHVEPSLQDYLIPKLSIQPIVENAIYHGLELKPDQGQITIACYTSDPFVIIEVEDNGVGIPEDKLHEINSTLTRQISDEHIGLANVMERIQLHYGKPYGIEISSQEQKGTKVTFKLPKK